MVINATHAQQTQVSDSHWPVSDSDALAQILAVTRSSSGDDGVYHVIYSSNDMQQPLQRAVLKSSENFSSESFGHVLARRLGFAVPDMRGLNGSQLRWVKESSVMQNCVSSCNQHIEHRQKGGVASKILNDMEGKKVFDLHGAQRMLMMSYINCFDLREENTLQQLSTPEQQQHFLHNLAKLFLLDLVVGNYDRFSFIMQRQLFENIPTDHLWGNLGNILCSFDDKNLNVIDTLISKPQNQDAYCQEVRHVIEALLLPEHTATAIDNNTFANMLKLDDMIENNFFEGQGFDDKAALAAIARESLHSHVQLFRDIAHAPEEFKSSLKQELVHKDLLQLHSKDDLQTFNDNYNFTLKVIQHAFK